MDVERPSRFAANGVVADLGNETVHDAAGHTVPLRAQAFSVLRHLYDRAGELVTKDELMQAVWPDISVTDDSLVQCIHEIRRVLNDDNHSLLRTVPRRGYKLVLPPDAFEHKALSRPRRPSGRTLALAIGGLAVVVLVAAGSLWLVTRDAASPRASQSKAIAVLPFENLGGDPAQAFVADGLSQDITTDLSQIPGLSVVARNLSWAYRDSTADVRTVARELGVQYVLEGSVQWQGEQVRVNAQLVDAAAGSHLWAERYDGPLEEIFAFHFQDKVIAHVVSALAVKLTDARPEPEGTDTAGLEGYDQSVLRGLYPGDALVIEASIPKSVTWLGFGFDAAWTIFRTKLLRVNAADNSFVEIDIKTTGDVRPIVAGEGAVWIQDLRRRLIIKVDPATNTVVQEIPAVMNFHQSTLGTGEGSIWVVTAVGGWDKMLTRFNARTGAVEAEIPLPSNGADVLVEFGSVWVAGLEGNVVYRIDPKTNAIIQTIAVHSKPKKLCALEGSVWVANSTDGFVDRIDGRNGQITASINAGLVFPGDGDLTCGGGYVWGHIAAWYNVDKALPSMPVVQIDPKRNEVIRRYIGGKGLGWDMRYGAGSLWITGSALFRIKPPG